MDSSVDKQRNHVVITGTGRAGTTALVELLTRLGLDTGYTADTLDSGKVAKARAGLEHDIRWSECPYVVKSPGFINIVDEIIDRDDIVIDHIFVPIRDLEAAAKSRRHVVSENLAELPLWRRIKRRLKPRNFDGGTWGTTSIVPGKQEEVLLRKIYDLMLAISSTNIPLTLLRFPRTVKDPNYLYGKLQPILPDTKLSLFTDAFRETVRPDLVHSFNSKDR